MKLIIFRQPPVIRHQRYIACRVRQFGFSDDKQPIKSSCQLLPALFMDVVPECSGILKRKPVGKALTRLDRGLGQNRHTVHLIQITYAAPVDGCRHFQPVGEFNLQPLSMKRDNTRAGRGAAIRPQISFGSAFFP